MIGPRSRPQEPRRRTVLPRWPQPSDQPTFRGWGLLSGGPHPEASWWLESECLREAELVDTAEVRQRAYDREDRIVAALDVPYWEAILRVLEECPEELLELRATLLQEHVWRQREGL